MNLVDSSGWLEYFELCQLPPEFNKFAYYGNLIFFNSYSNVGANNAAGVL